MLSGGAINKTHGVCLGICLLPTRHRLLFLLKFPQHQLMILFFESDQFSIFVCGSVLSRGVLQGICCAIHMLLLLTLCALRLGIHGSGRGHHLQQIRVAINEEYVIDSVESLLGLKCPRGRIGRGGHTVVSTVALQVQVTLPHRLQRLYVV